MVRKSMMMALALAGASEMTRAQDAGTQAVPYCFDLKHIVELAMTKERFSSIAGKPRQGNFLDTNVALAGWRDYSHYGADIYTCDSPALDNAGDVEKAQAEILHQIKACLGGAWS